MSLDLMPYLGGTFDDVEPYLDDIFGSDLFASGIWMIFGALAVIYLMLLIFGIVCYVFQSIGFYKIAKRRAIRHPWLSWISIGRMWILGSLSDQYHYVTKGRIKNTRKLLLGFGIISIAITILSCVLVIMAEVSTVSSDSALSALAFVLPRIFLWLISVCLSITMMVFECIALYDVYRSCNPGAAVAFLVLGIVFPVTTPFFIFACRNKDMGMPPRKVNPAPQMPPVFIQE